MILYALEGLYAELHRLGLPFSILGELQSRELTLESSAWTVRRSKSGVSVSLYWPCARPGETRAPSAWQPKRQATKAPRKNKRKQKNKAKKSLQPPTNTQPVTGAGNAVDDKQPEEEQVELGVDLCSCPTVEYQEKDGTPGVSYKDQSGDSGWIKVRGRRNRKPSDKPPSPRRRTTPSSTNEQSDTDSSTEDLVVPPSSIVKFVPFDGQPGLHISSSRTRSWTPIATRTRSRFKNK